MSHLPVDLLVRSRLCGAARPLFGRYTPNECTLGLGSYVRSWYVLSLDEFFAKITYNLLPVIYRSESKKSIDSFDSHHLANSRQSFTRRTTSSGALHTMIHSHLTLDAMAFGITRVHAFCISTCRSKNCKKWANISSLATLNEIKSRALFLWSPATWLSMRLEARHSGRGKQGKCAIQCWRFARFLRCADHSLSLRLFPRLQQSERTLVLLSLESYES
jgi:hypothetical protein